MQENQAPLIVGSPYRSLDCVHPPMVLRGIDRLVRRFYIIIRSCVLLTEDDADRVAPIDAFAALTTGPP